MGNEETKALAKTRGNFRRIEMLETMWPSSSLGRLERIFETEGCILVLERGL